MIILTDTRLKVSFGVHLHLKTTINQTMNLTLDFHNYDENIKHFKYNKFYGRKILYILFYLLHTNMFKEYVKNFRNNLMEKNKTAVYDQYHSMSNDFFQSFLSRKSHSELQEIALYNNEIFIFSKNVIIF